MTTFLAKDWVFNADGNGFVRYHAADDFERGIAAMQSAIEEMDDNEVRAFVAEMMAWQSADCEGERPDLANKIERVGEDAATAGWHNPSALTFSLSLVR